MFFHFRFLFPFLAMFFLFVIFHFFLYFPFVFLLKKTCFFLFRCVSLFSFLGFSKSVTALQDSLGKSAHSAGFICFVLARRHFSLWNGALSGDDQVESRMWWAAGGSSPTFVPESPD